MMDLLEFVSEHTYNGYFVDLYVRCNNDIAISLYEQLGYSVYRRVREYYGSIGPGGKDEEDAFGMCHNPNPGPPPPHIRVTDMRKPLPRDKDRKSVRPNGRDILVSAREVS